MSVKVLFLGPLADLAGVPEMDLPAPIDWAGLLNAIPEELAEQVRGKRVHLACAGQVLANKTDLRAIDGDEIALLPPVSGG